MNATNNNQSPPPPLLLRKRRSYQRNHSNSARRGMDWCNWSELNWIRIHEIGLNTYSWNWIEHGFMELNWIYTALCLVSAADTSQWCAPMIHCWLWYSRSWIVLILLAWLKRCWGKCTARSGWMCAFNFNFFRSIRSFQSNSCWSIQSFIIWAYQLLVSSSFSICCCFHFFLLTANLKIPLLVIPNVPGFYSNNPSICSIRRYLRS